MKTLYLVRHAKSDWGDPTLDDHDRPLNDRGLRDAPAMGGRLADAAASPVPVSADYYYRIPVRPIYKTYPVYHPGKEPSGYFERLTGLEPEIVSFDFANFKTPEAWIRAGEIVFDTPTDYDISGSPVQFRDPSYYTAIGIPVAADGTVPFVRYVVREKGKLEVGVLACGTCHTRLMPDGTVVKGAQGNFPFDRTALPEELPDTVLPFFRRLYKLLFGVPWLGDVTHPAITQVRITQSQRSSRLMAPMRCSSSFAIVRAASVLRISGGNMR